MNTKAQCGRSGWLPHCLAKSCTLGMETRFQSGTFGEGGWEVWTYPSMVVVLCKESMISHRFLIYSSVMLSHIDEVVAAVSLKGSVEKLVQRFGCFLKLVRAKMDGVASYWTFRKRDLEIWEWHVFFGKSHKSLLLPPPGCFWWSKCVNNTWLMERGYHPKDRGRSYVTCLAATMWSDKIIQLLIRFEMDVHSTPQLGSRTIISIRNPNHQS